MTTKITNKERQELTDKRLEQINTDKLYALQLFETHFKCSPGDMPQDKLDEWHTMTDKQKLKLIKRITEIEDKAMVSQAFTVHGYNVGEAKKYIMEMKHKQLVKFGVRKK